MIFTIDILFLIFVVHILKYILKAMFNYRNFIKDMIKELSLNSKITLPI